MFQKVVGVARIPIILHPPVLLLTFLNKHPWCPLGCSHLYLKLVSLHISPGRSETTGGKLAAQLGGRHAYTHLRNDKRSFGLSFSHRCSLGKYICSTTYIQPPIYELQICICRDVSASDSEAQLLDQLRLCGKPVSKNQRSRMSHVTAGVAEKSLRQPRRYSVSKVKVGFLAKASIERQVYNSVRLLNDFHKLRGHSECMPLYRLPVNLYFLQILPPSRLSHSQNS